MAQKKKETAKKPSEKGTRFSPKDLRPSAKSPQLTAIEQRPGYYKWWAKRKDFESILSKLNVTYEDVKDAVETDGDLVCIYVGIAVKESVRSRINWHVNDEHTPNRVEKGYLSTLRQSISSIFADDQSDKNKTDEILDCLKVEVFYSDHGIKSDEAERELEEKEKELMLQNLFVLNIRDNNHPKAGSIKKELRKLRKEAKARALKA